jgi:hypothetical protein
MVDLDFPEKWGSPEFHKSRMVRQQEEQQLEVKHPQGPREREQRRPEEAQAKSDAAFNAWFDRRFHQRLAEYMTEYSETVVKVTFKRLDAHKRALESEIMALRTEVATLKEVKGHNVIGLQHSDVA